MWLEVEVETGNNFGRGQEKMASMHVRKVFKGWYVYSDVLVSVPRYICIISGCSFIFFLFFFYFNFFCFLFYLFSFLFLRLYLPPGFVVSGPIVGFFQKACHFRLVIRYLYGRLFGWRVMVFFLVPNFLRI